MTLLSTIQNAATRIGQPRPSIVVAATDPTVQQLLALANEEGAELMKWGDWRALRKEKTFTSLAQEAQTAMIPTDLGAWIDETFWNRTAHRPIYGPISPQQWQAWKAADAFPVQDVFYLRGSSILMQPVPPAGETLAFEFTANLWCQSALSVGQSAWTADTDTGVLSERLMTLGIIWRYKQARGLNYDKDEDTYKLQVSQELAQDSPRSTHSFAGNDWDWYGRRPGIVVPDMSWDV